MSGFNLPPGVTVNDIPGNEPDDTPPTMRQRLARALLTTLGDLDAAGADHCLAATEHRGDCTGQAWTCNRCYADEHLAAADAILRENVVIPREGKCNEKDAPR